MEDRFGRRITYLRVSVTDRCNLRCRYCMPHDGVPLLPHDQVLSFEEIADVVRAAAELGIEKVRLTGGEPLVRRGILELVSMIAKVDGIVDLAMTTNGVLLKPFAAALKQAGLHRINVSLDTLDERRFAQITRGGELRRVLMGLEAASAVGLSPIKLNCVVEQSSEEPDACAVARFAGDHGYEVRFIREMDLNDGRFWVVQGGKGGDCSRCDRLRLTSHGYVRPCLFSDLAFSVRDLGAREALLKALEAKPESGMSSKTPAFSRIGG
jgi:cyclic pyranopterin phosphate synthase